MAERRLRCGDVYYVTPNPHDAKATGRPAVIVSCDTINEVCPHVQVVFLSQVAMDMFPQLREWCHVEIPRFKKLRPSVAMCEKITPIQKVRVGTYICTLPDDLMAQLQTAFCNTLNIT